MAAELPKLLGVFTASNRRLEFPLFSPFSSYEQELEEVGDCDGLHGDFGTTLEAVIASPTWRGGDCDGLDVFTDLMWRFAIFCRNRNLGSQNQF